MGRTNRESNHPELRRRGLRPVRQTGRPFFVCLALATVLTVALTATSLNLLEALAISAFFGGFAFLLILALPALWMADSVNREQQHRDDLSPFSKRFWPPR